MKHIPKAAIARLLKEELGGQRISADLVEEIGNILEETAKKLAKKASLVATFQRVITVKPHHLKTALDMERAQNK
jgi:histone H3/H4